MREKWNKKGQEGGPSGVLIGIVIVVIAAIIIILFFTGGFGWFADKLGFLPNDLNSAVQACTTYAGSESLMISYCEYRELRIDGKKQFINCDQIYEKALIVLGSADKVGFTKQNICEVTPVQYCTQLQTNLGTAYKETTIVDGKPCGGAGSDDWGVDKSTTPPIAT